MLLTVLASKILKNGELYKHVYWNMDRKSHFHGKYILGKIISISYTKIVTLYIFPRLPSNQLKVASITFFFRFSFFFFHDRHNFWAFPHFLFFSFLFMFSFFLSHSQPPPFPPSHQIKLSFTLQLNELSFFFNILILINFVK